MTIYEAIRFIPLSDDSNLIGDVSSSADEIRGVVQECTITSALHSKWWIN